jgi:RNA polymerase sigma-70 factor, ECF subfamily
MACGIIVLISKEMQLATTHLLRQIGSGDPAPVQQLFEVLYQDLHARAEVLFRHESVGHTLQPTALVNEAYIRMIDQKQANWRDRAHFCGVASIAMRRILVDHARKKRAQRRGSGRFAEDIPLDAIVLSTQDPDDVLFAHELIEEVRANDENQARIIELRFFGGLTVHETAEVLGMTQRQVEDEWTMIRAMIRAMIHSQARETSGSA